MHSTRPLTTTSQHRCGRLGLIAATACMATRRRGCPQMCLAALAIASTVGHGRCSWIIRVLTAAGSRGMRDGLQPGLATASVASRWALAPQGERAARRLEEHGCLLRSTATRQHGRTRNRRSQVRCSSCVRSWRLKRKDSNSVCCWITSATKGEFAMASCQVLFCGACCYHTAYYTLLLATANIFTTLLTSGNCSTAVCRHTLHLMLRQNATKLLRTRTTPRLYCSAGSECP